METLTLVLAVLGLFVVAGAIWRCFVLALSGMVLGAYYVWEKVHA